MSKIKLKICGVKTADEARQLAELGVDYIGLNFVPESGRCITLEEAFSIITVAQGSKLQTVALFRDQPLEMVNDYAQRLGINYIQLHGSESNDYIQQVQAPVMKAVAADPKKSAAELLEYVDHSKADFFVLDRHIQGRGPLVSLDLVNELTAANPGKIFLAGGLTPENLPDVLKQVKPFGIDIASGVRTGDTLDMSKVRKCLNVIYES